MSDDRDFYADCDYDMDDTLVPPPPRMTPSELAQRMEHLRAEWAAIVEQGDDKDDEIVEYGPHGEVFVGKDREFSGWLIRDELPADEQAANQKKETTNE